MGYKLIRVRKRKKGKKRIKGGDQGGQNVAELERGWASHVPCPSASSSVHVCYKSAQHRQQSIVKSSPFSDDRNGRVVLSLRGGVCGWTDAPVCSAVAWRPSLAWYTTGALELLALEFELCDQRPRVPEDIFVPFYFSTNHLKKFSFCRYFYLLPPIAQSVRVHEQKSVKS